VLAITLPPKYFLALHFKVMLTGRLLFGEVVLFVANDCSSSVLMFDDDANELLSFMNPTHLIGTLLDAPVAGINFALHMLPITT
jgi:hypothetical protein